MTCARPAGHRRSRRKYFSKAVRATEIETFCGGDLAENCYIAYLPERKDCVVIDPGFDPAPVLARIRQLGKTVAAVLLTHGHFDHVGGVERLQKQTDCPVYLHPAENTLPEYLTAGKLFYTHTYAQGDVCCAAGLELHILHTPGHTPGSVCLDCDGALFTGDTLFAGSCGRTDLEGGDGSAMEKSLRRLREMTGDRQILPGHGENTSLRREKLCNPYLR